VKFVILSAEVHAAAESEALKDAEAYSELEMELGHSSGAWDAAVSNAVVAAEGNTNQQVGIIQYALRRLAARRHNGSH
jgi:hypothetical protein